MKARPIEIMNKEDEQAIRARVQGTIFVDVADPTVAYACGQCGNIISFGGSGVTMSNNSVQCSVCGSMNTI